MTTIATVQTLIAETVRTLFLLGIPLVIALLLGGILAGVFQAVTAIQDPIISYTLRLVSVVLILYMMMPHFVRTILRLAEMVYS